MLGIQPLTFVVLRDTLSVEAFNARLPSFVERRFPAKDREAAKVALRAFPVADLKTFNLDRSLFASRKSMQRPNCAAYGPLSGVLPPDIHARPESPSPSFRPVP